MGKADADLIVIGSGFGGSVCAMRAAEANLRVIVLERGGHQSAERFEAMAEGRAPLLLRSGPAGLIDAPSIDGLFVISGSAVGGGSHVYTAVTTPAPEEVFADRWPAGITAGGMTEYYRRVRDVIAPSPSPRELPRTGWLERVGHRMGVAATRLPLAIDWPADPLAMTAPPDRQPPRREFVSWLRGGRATKKRTLDRTYLARAIEAGAKVLALHEATAIAPHAGGYAVSVRRHEEGRSFDASLTAPRVVLAAGTVNTVRLLLQYRATGSLPNLSAALGARFFTNGDFGALLLIPADTVAPDCGPPVTGWLDCWAADRLYLMEAGMVPGLSRTALRLLARLAGGRRGFRPLGWAWCFGVMGFDDVPGSLSMDSRGRMVFRNASSSSSVFHQRTMRRLRQLAEAAGATLVAPPDWLARRRPLTVHPLGGAAMADDPKRGVTDSFGEVFGYPGLFVADGSLLPVPTGCAPSMTIAALAERVAERIVSAP